MDDGNSYAGHSARNALGRQSISSGHRGDSFCDQTIDNFMVQRNVQLEDQGSIRLSKDLSVDESAPFE